MVHIIGEAQPSGREIQPVIGKHLQYTNMKIPKDHQETLAHAIQSLEESYSPRVIKSFFKHEKATPDNISSILYGVSFHSPRSIRRLLGHTKVTRHNLVDARELADNLSVAGALKVLEHEKVTPKNVSSLSTLAESARHPEAIVAFLDHEKVTSANVSDIVDATERLHEKRVSLDVAEFLNREDVNKRNIRQKLQEFEKKVDIEQDIKRKGGLRLKRPIRPRRILRK